MKSILINNQWSVGRGNSFSSSNPANQELVWQGSSANAADIDLAVKAARQAFQSWALLSFQERCQYVEKYVEILTVNKEEYAEVIHQENGKPLWEARSEVATMIAKYQTSITAYNTRTGTVNNHAAVSSMLTHRAIGAIVVFGPFNFPGHLPNGHIIPALIAGNTIVYKPSELTPLCGELMAKYWLEAGLPQGVLNLVQGDGLTGAALTAHPDINGILFTGSYNVGKTIHAALAGRPEVMLALEMGGNNPLIISSEIKDLDGAVYNTIQSSFISSGQRCTCARRLYVPKNKLGDQFVERLIAVSKNIAISDGINHLNMNQNQQAFMGPVISLRSRDNIIEFKNNLLSQYNATELLELKKISETSALLTPGIIEFADLNNNIPDQECFGPLLQIFRYNEFDEAIIAANNTAYGLAAGLLSDNKEEFEKFYQLIRAGIVNWNRPTTGAAGNLPFGGVGHSGNYCPSAFYAADYCSYPMATQYTENVTLPTELAPGILL